LNIGMNVRALAFLAMSALAVSPTKVAAQIGALPTGDVRLDESKDSKFHVGDIWQYKTRPAEERSRITILRIENSPSVGIIVHVAVDNLTWQDCQNKPFAQSIPHMPFARSAIEASVTKRIASTRDLPKFEEGYRGWRDAFSKQHAGVYIIPMKYAVSVAEKTWRSGVGCK
jgi:hypothetical protein